MRQAYLAAAACLAAMSSACVTTRIHAQDVVAMERAALDRWGRGDPQGYLDIYASEVTYFDPYQQKRVDGIAAMTALLKPLFGRIKVDRYDMIDPKVERRGDVAVLTFNLVSQYTMPDGKPGVTRWNTTAVYARVGGQWRIIHHHFSHTGAGLSPPA